MSSDHTGMSANEFKRRYRMSSGWPNVQREVEARQNADKESKREKDMLEAGAAITRRGPGRPPKGSDE